MTLREITDVNLIGRVTEERKERQLSCTEGLFIAVAWVLKPALRFFMLCPEVFFLDVTLHSNNKGFHLLTFLSRSSIGKQVVWMWIFIPNQQRFSFRWVFQEAIPALLPQWLRDQVVFFMKDGDQQQRNEILGAMTNVFVNTVEGTCGFHVVNMGRKKHVPPIGISNLNLKKWTVVVNIHSWIYSYSWMRPGHVEDEEEYNISKHLLEKFVCSLPILGIFEGNALMIRSILKFLHGNVYTCESLYLSFRCKHIHHFDTSHSSAHEGTNNSLKSHSASI